MIMKPIYKLSVYVLCMLTITLCSCNDSAFESLNDNPAKSSNVDPNYQLSQCEARYGDFGSGKKQR